MVRSMLGAYGPWAAGLAGEGPGRDSPRNPRFGGPGQWLGPARARVSAGLREPRIAAAPAEVAHAFDYDGLRVEHLSWRLDHGPPTEAILLKPLAASRPLPAVLALHDHGNDKYFGAAKVAQMADALPAPMRDHREAFYGGASWANALARRGYVVLAHDAFSFGSRRLRATDLPIPGAREPRPGSAEDIAAYNAMATQHEGVMAKSLLCAGTTLPGVTLAEDRKALDYLCARPDVDPDRVACAGFSGGGLRAVFLAATDDRVACACCAAMMTTWRDLLLNVSFHHSWMAIVPGLAPDLDYPEVLGLRAPMPALVQFASGDATFTPPEMRRAHAILGEIYAKAGARDRYRGTFFDGGHAFGLRMQGEAFAWLDAWLKP